MLDLPKYILSETIQGPGYAKQHDNLVLALRELGAEVIEVPLVAGLQDSVFMKDNAVFAHATDSRGRVMLARPKNPERKPEPIYREDAFKKLGFTIQEKAECTFEGGDFAMAADQKNGFLGYGFRSDKKIITQLENFLNIQILPLELTDSKLFHLDLVLSALSNGTVLACPQAMTTESWKTLSQAPSINHLIPISLEQARKYALNMVQVNDTVIMSTGSPHVVDFIEKSGLKVYQTDLGCYHERQGSAACLVAKMHN